MSTFVAELSSPRPAAELEALAVAAIAAADPQHASRSFALVLGSGWGGVVEQLLECEGCRDYADIPGFPVSTVAGHAGRLLWGRFAGVPAYCMQGRFHYYEGYSMQQITLPVRAFAALGVRTLCLTNAAGGIHPAFQPGDLMLIADHLNFMGDHPLRGPNDDARGPRFPDMTHAWDPALRAAVRAAAARAGIGLREGSYLAVSGPTFETPAEVRAFARLGADAVGMSTVPECIVARHAGLRVFGISCITNLAAGISPEPLSHEDVDKVAGAATGRLIDLLRAAVPAALAVA